MGIIKASGYGDIAIETLGDGDPKLK